MVPLRLLHLEDDPRDAQLLRHTLSAEGLSLEIVHVTNKLKFETAFNHGPFDLVVTD
jgi:CheY-like chemotaxis protein